MGDIIPLCIIVGYFILTMYVIFTFTIKLSLIGSIAIGLSNIPLVMLVGMFSGMNDYIKKMEKNNGR